MIGKTLAHYEILALLGKGGMGEVYRARDSKLDRDVAIKLLPADFSRDPERLARFRREAKVLASLNHTNIASIHGIEEDQGQVFLVLELADGEDLAHRIARGPLPVEDALNIARQLAHGLEQAHERGVVHRDLKPANVKVAPDGSVKILDFGLARAFAGESAGEGNLASSPTITAAMTQAGTILGTAAYMSPEQARGMEVDRRADIWAFGVILYEMLTGAQLFQGETISDTLAEVIKTDPDLEALPASVPLGLRWLVERCLQKRPSRRLRDIGEARVLLESDLDHPPAGSGSARSVVLVEKPRWVIPVLVSVGVLALALGYGISTFLRPPPPPPSPIHATILPPPGTEIRLGRGSHLAVSPDGTRVVFAARDSAGVSQLWVRRFDSPDAHVLSGTLQASYPFWSPDGRKIGFFADGKLKKIDSDGGVATSLCEAPEGRGGSWTVDDRILFTPEARGVIQLVAASGGAPATLTQMDSLRFSHRWPLALPDGEHFLYLTLGDKQELRWRPIDDATGESVLLTGVERAMFADGHLFFGRDGALWARPFDPARGSFLGDEFLIADAVITASNFGSGAYSASDGGTLVYAAGLDQQGSLLGVFDREGSLVDRFEFKTSGAQDPNLSSDGRYLALALYPLNDQGAPDIWIRDLERQTLSRFTTDENVDDPVWSPEGDRLIYSTQDGVLRARSTQGSRDLLLEVPVHNDAISHDWSTDGKFVLFSTSQDTRSIFVLPVDDPEGIYPLVRDEHWTGQATFSPDTRWVAYTSNESGMAQIYLRRFAEGGGTWQVSPGFGRQPRWDGNGSLIYYQTEDGIAATPVTFVGDRPEFGKERMVLRPDHDRGFSNTHMYDLSEDGTRFVVMLNNNASEVTDTALELVLGWKSIIGKE